LPTQSWDQYLDDLLGSQIAQCDLGLDKDQIELYNSFQETSADIEEWTTGDASHRILDKLPPEEAHICYGMVSKMLSDLYGGFLRIYFDRALSLTTTNSVPQSIDTHPGFQSCRTALR
jgi:hypothetical protein